MRKIVGGSWQLSCSVIGLRSVGVVAALLVFFFSHSCAADQSSLSLVKPDQYNVEVCEDYFNKLKPGLASGTSYDLQEQYTINRLCEARSTDLSRLAGELAWGAAAHGAPLGDSTRVKTLSAEFVKAVIESNEFDAPGYDRISISGAIIVGDLNLTKIKINNALQLRDVQFLGSIDFSYSSTEHNLDVSGTLPDAKGLCLKGFQTKASVFIDHLLYLPDKQPAKKSTSFCTDAFLSSPSIGLQGARIEGELSIRNAAVKTIDAVGARIAGQVLIQDSTISEFVDFSAATAGGIFFLQVQSPRELHEDTKCTSSTVFMEGTNVSGSAEFVRSDLCGISMTGAHVLTNVNLLGSTLAFFDFTGSNAEGDLQIGPSRGPAGQSSGRLPVWLLPFGAPPANLVLSHSSVTLVRVALNNWPNMCDIGVKPENRNGKCPKPHALTIDYCTSQKRVPPSALPDSDDQFISISKIGEWTGFTDLIFGLGKTNPTTIVADFRFKAFGKPIYCAWDVAIYTDGYGSDYISEDFLIDRNAVEQWLGSTQYSPAEYQLIYDLLVTNGQSSDAKKIGYKGKIMETRLDFVRHSWPAFFTMLLSRWTIGYGYCSYLAILWAIFFCVIGAVLFSRANPKSIRVNEGIIDCVDRSGWRKYIFGPHRFRVIKYTDSLRYTGKYRQDYGVVNPFGYSFDALLPIIRLRELHYQIELGGWRHYYFYLQRIVGWILGIFVLAAFSGLTK
jgi:uncharacterized protein YjbI with pentapeptide repeats